MKLINVMTSLVLMFAISACSLFDKQHQDDEHVGVEVEDKSISTQAQTQFKPRIPPQHQDQADTLAYQDQNNLTMGQLESNLQNQSDYTDQHQHQNISSVSQSDLDPFSDDQNNPLSDKIIYFDYNSDQIASEYQTIIQYHGQYLLDNPQAMIELEGHTDERGSREFNIGLGERRAQSVYQSLLLQGVSPNQIQMISYGEEMPAVDGHDESAWKLNRRVVIVYIN